MPWHGDLRAETGDLLIGEQENKVFIDSRTGIDCQRGYPGSVGLMRSIPTSVGKTEEELSKALFLCVFSVRALKLELSIYLSTLSPSP